MVRRDLHLEKLSDAVIECQRLLATGYVRNGKWSLGQVCRHVRLTIDASVDGYPRWMSIGMPLRPLLRWLLLPRLLRGASPAGIKTAKCFVPADGLNDEIEVADFSKSVERFCRHQGALHRHPGFGKLDRDLFERFHAAHAAHHLGFLADPTEDE